MEDKITSIEVIGSGCTNCEKLHELAIKAAKELGLEVEVGYSKDIQKALAMGVMQFPVMAVNGKAVLTGSTANVEKIKKAIVRGSFREEDRSKGCSCGGNR